MVRRGHDAKAGSIIVLPADRPWRPQIRIPELSAQAPRISHEAKVSAETCGASRPVPNGRAVGRQEPPCSASTLPPMQFPAQPKPRLVLYETMQSRAQRPFLPRSTAEIHASPTLPIISFTQSVFSKHPEELGLVCVKSRAEQEPELGIFGAAGGHATCIILLAAVRRAEAVGVAQVTDRPAWLLYARLPAGIPI
jgi:hypothetical protein